MIIADMDEFGWHRIRGNPGFFFCENDAKFSDFVKAEYFLTYDLKMCDNGTLIKILCFWTFSVVLCLFKT
jgi:hypothetical protein